MLYLGEFFVVALVFKVANIKLRKKLQVALNLKNLLISKIGNFKQFGDNMQNLLC